MSLGCEDRPMLRRRLAGEYVVMCDGQRSVLWGLEARRDFAHSPAAELAHLSGRVAALVGALDPGGQRAAVRVGLEHEYCVFDAGRQVDFGALIHGLSLGVWA